MTASYFCAVGGIALHMIALLATLGGLENEATGRIVFDIYIWCGYLDTVGGLMVGTLTTNKL